MYKKWIGLLFTLALILTACPPQSKISGIVASATPSSVTSGGNSSLTATVSGEGTFDSGVTWSIVSGGGSLSSNTGGNVTYTAPNVTVQTTVQIKALAADKTTTKTIEIVVQSIIPLVPKVNPLVIPAQALLPDKNGNPQPVAASRDNQGVRSDFVVGQVLLKPKTTTDLENFLQRYEGTVIGDNTIPEPPASLGVTLSAEQRKANEFLVHINIAKVDTSTFVSDAAKVGIGGLMELSSQDGLLTLAGAASALAAGFDVSLNSLNYPTQTFPLPLLNTQERAQAGGGFDDAFNTTRFQTISNLTLAWQFVAAHGIQRRVRVAIIDGGFWLNTNGTPTNPNSDLPTNPIQYDFVQSDYFADGPNPVKCSSGNTCNWHGTGSAGVATGIVNNRLGAAGTGGQVADPMLFKFSGGRDQSNLAIRTAVAWGADVISMSFGSDCSKLSCRLYDREHSPFDDAVNAGSRTVFVAAAGNGEGSPLAGYDVGDPHFYHPCLEDHVLCVGALKADTTGKVGYSNFGNRVSIFAPTDIPVYYPNDNADGSVNPGGAAVQQIFNGTSASTPFVAGVIAMMKAINPNLNGDDVNRILIDTSKVGTGEVSRYIDAYAAVRKVAEGISGVQDGFEPNDSVNAARVIAPGSYPNLSLHTDTNPDYYRLNLSNPSLVNLDFIYPDTLGKPSIGDGYGLSADQLGCGSFSQQSLTPRTNGLAMNYFAPAGSYLLKLSGKLNAYNLSWTATPLASFVAAADGYESNNDFAHASNLGSGARGQSTITPGDVDYYRFQSFGSINNPYLTVTSGFGVSNTNVPLTLTLFDQNGKQIGQPVTGSADCQISPNFGTLSAGVFFIKVAASTAGTQGQYQFSAGTNAKGNLGVTRDRAYQLTHPGDPVEGRLQERYDGYIFTQTAAAKAINLASNEPLHFQILDTQGKLLFEGQPDSQNSSPGFHERLILSRLTVGNEYLIQIARQTSETDPPTAAVPTVAYTMSWDSSSPTTDSGNLILNGNTEDGNQPASDTGGVVSLISGWIRPVGSNLTVIYYNSPNFPKLDDPGPLERGYHFFAGGPDNASSSADQTVNLAQKLGSSWMNAIDTMRVQFRLSGFLGGFYTQNDGTTLTASFLDETGKELGQSVIGTVTAAERAGQTGLLLRQTEDALPIGTRQVKLHLEFSRSEGAYNDGYADNLEFRLQDFGP